MDEKFRRILDDLPGSPPCSCLDPFREFISELRRRGRTYREVVRILADHCNIRISVSTVYRFLHSRTRSKRQLSSRHFAKPPEIKKERTAVKSNLPATDSEKAGVKSDQIHQRIAALKSRQALTKTTPKLFDYDPDQPLRLLQKPRNKHE